MAALVALLALRGRSLAPSGAMAAMVVGALAIGAGWDWGALLIAYFVSASALSRLGAERKARRTASIVAKTGARDATQVLANGLPFAAAAVGMMLAPSVGWQLAGAGALAAAAADTWATEIGTLVGGTPRLLLGGGPVPPGTSGGVTWAGTLAAAVGGAFVGAVAWLLGWPAAVLPAALLGGVAGALADSLLGATVQARRRCLRCGMATERIVHPCGEQTQPAGGLSWLDNDAVNLLASTVGGVLALLWV